MNFRFIRNFLFYFTVIILLIRCASTGAPSGGPKDTWPPKLVEEESSPNFSTNYSPQKVELIFDEWIELKNQSKEILISPPFFKKPKITQRGKKVTVEFPIDEPLRPDATYIINFGNSIVDFTEANPAEGFKFLFATGDRLDSLSFTGNIIDAYGQEPIGDVLIMLYDQLGDSVVVTEKPFYYSRANSKGEFEFEYLKNDTFKLVVIEDLNYNYLLDDEVERLAFIDSTFTLNDSTKFNPELRLFQPEQSTRITNSDSRTPGVITTVFNKKAKSINHTVLYPKQFDYSQEITGDTIKYWFAETYDSVGLIFDVDTLDFTIKPFDTTFYNQKIRIRENNLTRSKLAPFDSLTIAINAPIDIIDTSLFILSDLPKLVSPDSFQVTNDSLVQGFELDSLNNSVDSLGRNTIKLDSLIQDTLGNDAAINDTLAIHLDELRILDSLMNSAIDSISFYNFDYETKIREIKLYTEWKEGHKYQLKLLPGAIIDIYGRQCDTLTINFSTNSIDEYGNINLSVVDLDSTQQYIILLNDKEEQISKRIIDNKSQDQLFFNRLPASAYNIHVIKDENRDNKWTTGDYWKQRQPELMKRFELQKLRENWDLDALISWDGTTKDTLGSGIDSTFIQLDSLNYNNPIDTKKSNKKPDRKSSNDSSDRKRGVRGRRG